LNPRLPREKIEPASPAIDGQNKTSGVGIRTQALRLFEQIALTTLPSVSYTYKQRRYLVTYISVVLYRNWGFWGLNGLLCIWQTQLPPLRFSACYGTGLLFGNIPPLIAGEDREVSFRASGGIHNPARRGVGWRRASESRGVIGFERGVEMQREMLGEFPAENSCAAERKEETL
jgi:hypothetical protein